MIDKTLKMIFAILIIAAVFIGIVHNIALDIEEARQLKQTIRYDAEMKGWETTTLEIR